MAHIGDNVSGNWDQLHTEFRVMVEESRRQGETLRGILDKLGLLERALGDFTTLHAVQKNQMEHDRARLAKAEEAIITLGEKVQILERNYEKAESSIKAMWWLASPLVAAVGGLVLSALRDKLK